MDGKQSGLDLSWTGMAKTRAIGELVTFLGQFQARPVRNDFVLRFVKRMNLWSCLPGTGQNAVRTPFLFKYKELSLFGTFRQWTRVAREHVLQSYFSALIASAVLFLANLTKQHNTSRLLKTPSLVLDGLNWFWTLTKLYILSCISIFKSLFKIFKGVAFVFVCIHNCTDTKVMKLQNDLLTSNPCKYFSD